MATKRLIKCEDCGKSLPMHLLGLVGDFGHVCACGAVYRDKDCDFVRVGNQRNPVAEYDEAQKKAKKAKKPTKPKACKCVDKVNKELAKQSHQLVLAFRPKGLVLPVIMTEETYGSKKVKPVSLVATFCPFCGKEYPR